jgi:nitrate reductase beta subunit
VCQTGGDDANFAGLDASAYLHFRSVFLFYLPRLCEHCLNPACVASCPSGALYKREEDGIVLVDQQRCRGWRYCVSGCPYKKVYFNWKSGRSEKCVMCYPRIESGQPTLCAHSCVGRIRYLGVVLYDAQRVAQAAATLDERQLVAAQRDLLLDPEAPEVARKAIEQGIAPAMLDAARRSPVYPLCVTWRLALPLHPEFRTLPMVWYIPPLSPMAPGLEETTPEQVAAAGRIPLRYLANLLSAGDEEPVRLALQRLAALRAFMRGRRLGQGNETVLEAAGLTPESADQIYRLLALAPLERRFALPASGCGRDGVEAHRSQGQCGFESGTWPAAPR